MPSLATRHPASPLADLTAFSSRQQGRRGINLLLRFQQGSGYGIIRFNFSVIPTTPMSDIINSIILGIVEGITEFLPVSSTGHLIVTQDCSTLRAATPSRLSSSWVAACWRWLWFYFHKLWEQARLVSHDKAVQRFWLGVIVAFLPAAFVGLALHKYITAYLFNGTTVAISLIVGGIARVGGSKACRCVNKPPAVWKICRCASACWSVAPSCVPDPRVSRSASTIMGGMLVGLNRTTATSFSFFLSIPTLCRQFLLAAQRFCRGVGNMGH